MPVPQLSIAQLLLFLALAASVKSSWIITVAFFGGVVDYN